MGEVRHINPYPTKDSPTIVGLSTPTANHIKECIMLNKSNTFTPRVFNTNPQQTLAINNPLVTALDRSFKPIFTAPLSDIDGMAYGTREDFAKGNPKLTTNWCSTLCTTHPCTPTRQPYYWLPHQNTDAHTTRGFSVIIGLVEFSNKTYDSAQALVGEALFSGQYDAKDIRVEYCPEPEKGYPTCR